MSDFYWLHAPYDPEAFGPNYQEKLKPFTAEGATAANTAGWRPAITAVNTAINSRPREGRLRTQLDTFMRQASGYLQLGGYYLEGAEAAVQTLVKMFPEKADKLPASDYSMLFGELPGNTARHAFLHLHIRMAASEGKLFKAREDVAQGYRTHADLQKRCDLAEGKQEKLEAELTLCKAQLESSKAAHKSLKASTADTDSRVPQLQTQLQELEKKQQDWELELGLVKQEYALAYHEWQLAEAKREELQAKLEVLVDANKKTTLFGRVLLHVGYVDEEDTISSSMVERQREEVEQSMQKFQEKICTARGGKINAEQIAREASQRPEFRLAVARLKLEDLQRKDKLPEALSALIETPKNPHQSGEDGSPADHSGEAAASAATPAASEQLQGNGNEPRDASPDGPNLQPSASAATVTQAAADTAAAPVAQLAANPSDSHKELSLDFGD